MNSSRFRLDELIAKERGRAPDPAAMARNWAAISLRLAQSPISDASDSLESAPDVDPSASADSMPGDAAPDLSPGLSAQGSSAAAAGKAAAVAKTATVAKAAALAAGTGKLALVGAIITGTIVGAQFMGARQPHEAPAILHSTPAPQVNTRPPAQPVPITTQVAHEPETLEGPMPADEAVTPVQLPENTAAAKPHNSNTRREVLTQDDLLAEVELIGKVRDALRGKRYGEALARIHDHKARFAHSGRLTQEREFYEIDALCGRGSVSAAKNLAERFLQKHPRSPYAAHVRESCGLNDNIQASKNSP